MTIPKGMYCYGSGPNGKRKFCPHYSYTQVFGIEVPYCKYLNKAGCTNTKADDIILEKLNGDIEEFVKILPLDLLWDQVKECGINE